MKDEEELVDVMVRERDVMCVRCGSPATHLHDGHAYCEMCRNCYPYADQGSASD